MIAASSTSQSSCWVIALSCRIGWSGPITLVGGLEKMTGFLGRSGDVSSVEFGDDLRVTLADGTTHVHRRVDDGWHIELHAGGATSSIDPSSRGMSWLLNK